MARIIERVRPRYEVQDVQFGRVYRWRPERILVECRCGRRLSITRSTTSCPECSADYTDAFRNESAEGYQSDEALHPWRYLEEHRQAEGGLPF